MAFHCNKSKREIEQTAEFLKIIAEPSRLKILCALNKQELCVCEIWKKLAIPQNLASHHLKILKAFGLLSSRKEGVKVIYSVNSKMMDKYYSYLSNYFNKN
jgi:ArsR family transcriptional regulator